MLTETSNSSVSGPLRDSLDVKAANKERQTIISTVSLLSCCCTETVACMCKQITPEKLLHKQFKAVAPILRHNAYGPTAGRTAICWVVTVFDCQEAGGMWEREADERRGSVSVGMYTETKHKPFFFSCQQSTRTVCYSCEARKTHWMKLAWRHQDVKNKRNKSQQNGEHN